VANLRKVIYEIRHPMGLRHPYQRRRADASTCTAQIDLRSASFLLRTCSLSLVHLLSWRCSLSLVHLLSWRCFLSQAPDRAVEREDTQMDETVDGSKLEACFKKEVHNCFQDFLTHSWEADRWLNIFPYNFFFKCIGKNLVNGPDHHMMIWNGHEPLWNLRDDA